MKTSKEKLIAAGAKKSAEGYPTIDDIPSNWTEKEKGKSGKVANQEEEEERKQEGQQIAGAAKSPSEQEGPPKQEPKDNLDEALDREPEDPIFVPTTH
ncbi:unnamed protein product [Heligmosomoides polygyrus]|uniref:Uncharacterized protein n=1 Tax=Heligmosomoides polygyrus TaxID=6339 RepID=A0A3P8F4G9_HELPZ|nr:unnamed protein product [Heligmosomoides polygyrus]